MKIKISFNSLAYKYIQMASNNPIYTYQHRNKYPVSYTHPPPVAYDIQFPFFCWDLTCLISLVSILGAIAIDMSSWNSSLQAYGM